MKNFGWRALLAGAALLCLAACAPHSQYRTDYTACTRSATNLCENAALERATTVREQEYWLNFIEFDDQGQLWDRKQMNAVDTRLQEAQEHLLIVVFVHGWKHSAESGDDNIKTFRRVLAKLADSEAYLARTSGNPARRVAGVYLGWRGGSVTLPGAKEMTFWSRKETAQRVGAVGVSEVLSRLENVQRTKGTFIKGENRTRLAVVGHSFGGAVVYTALSNILQNRFVSTAGPDGVSTRVVGFGNLVVLINPAFEASLYAPLSDMSIGRGWYPDTQLPTLAILTSEDDLATRYAFPAGRWFSTLFEYERTVQRPNPRATPPEDSIDTGAANRSAIGHFEPYRTHRLYPVERKPRDQLIPLTPENSVAVFKQASAGWRDDKPGSKIAFGDLVLEHGTNSSAHNPCLVIYVDGDLIQDHNDIDDERVIEFLKQLISISAQSEVATTPGKP